MTTPGSIRDALDVDPRPWAGLRNRRDLIRDCAFVAVAMIVVLLNDVDWLTSPTVVLPPGAVWAMAAAVPLIARRRWPLAVGLALAVAPGFLPLAAGPALLALLSLAVHRTLGSTVAVGALLFATNSLRLLLDGGRPLDVVAQIAVWAVLVALMITWGTTVQRRRQLVISLITLARTAESTERERVERVRAAERSLLAREMHDVLAHRMSLVSLHAGAIEFRPDASPDETRQAAGVIRAGVHQMLVDLRELTAMLRDEHGSELPHSLVSVAILFEESESAGSPVDADIDVEGDLSALPGPIDRAAYRIVQEGLTNARKHGGTVRIAVSITGSPAAGLTVRIRQPLLASATTPRGIPGSGSGLMGLTERATLAGGSLQFGPDGADFVLAAHLPWQKGA